MDGYIVDKICTKCGELKLLPDFKKNKKKTNGRAAHCKLCENKYNRMWKKNNRVKVREYHKKDYKKNIGWYIAYRKEYYGKNKNYILAYQKEYNAINKKTISAAHRGYYKNNNVILRYKSARRLTLKKGLDFSISFSFYEKAIKAPCFYCDNSESANGLDRKNNNIGYTKENVVACCQWCNELKGNRLSFQEAIVAIEAITNLRERMSYNGKVFKA